MGDKISLKVDPREVFGKKVTKLRQDGLTPGVVYGPGMDPIAVQFDSGEARKVVAAAGKHTPVHLTGAKRRIAMIKDVTLDPTRNAIRHISFHAVKADEPVIAEVPIVLVGEGESEAERSGLIVLQSLETLEVKALPMDLPNQLTVDITKLAEAGDRVTVADITVDGQIEIVDRAAAEAEQSDDDEEEKPTIMDLVIATVYEPSALQAANEAAAGDAESPDAEQVEPVEGEAEGETESDEDKSDEKSE